jgi:hypothetical protein
LVVRQPKDMFFYADYRSSLQLDANYTNACWFEDAAEPSALAS